MNKDDMNQIIFNALETEHSHAKNEKYKAKVAEAMKDFRESVNRPRPTPSRYKGYCLRCGSMDIDTPCD